LARGSREQAQIAVCIIYFASIDEAAGGWRLLTALPALFWPGLLTQKMQANVVGCT